MTLTDAASRVRVCPVCDTQTLDARCPRDGQPTVRPDELLARAVVDPLVGQTLESKFEVQARVGSGSMGTVYRALHLRTGATIALKVLHPALAEQPSAIRRFLVEAQIIAVMVFSCRSTSDDNNNNNINQKHKNNNDENKQTTQKKTTDNNNK